MLDSPRHCANCGAALASDQPAEAAYCQRCTDAWERGQALRADAAAGRCANCGAELPAGQSEGYCPTCAGAWQRRSQRPRSPR